MDDKMDLILEKIAMLQNWTREMASLQENPYIKDFNITKMLEDLGGFVTGLRKDVEELKTLYTETPGEPEANISTTAEQ